MTEATVSLQTERLLLRPFRPDDVEDILLYAPDSEYGRYLVNMPDHPYTRKDAEEFLSRTEPVPTDTNADFAVVFEEHVIGGVDLTVDPKHKIAELGYAIAREHWGKGFAVEAATALIDWGFRTYDLVKVFATANVQNTQSRRVMEKLGMVHEGILRQHQRFRGHQVDEVLCGILREEWQPSAL